MPTNSMTFAGLDGIYVSFVNAGGLMIGFAKISTNGSESGLRRLKASQTLPNALPAPVRKTIPGDDGIADSFLFSSAELPGGDIEMGTNDLALDAAAQSSAVWTLGNWNLGIYGISTPTLGNMMLLAHQQAHSKDAGASLAGFKNVLYPNAQLLPLAGDNPAHQTEGKNRYTAQFLPFSTFPLGQLLDSTNFNVTDGTKVEWFSVQRTFFYAKIFDGIATTIVVDKTPVDVASTKVGLTTSGGAFSLATVSTVVPATKTITLSVAPAAGTLGVAMFEGR